MNFIGQKNIKRSTEAIPLLIYTGDDWGHTSMVKKISVREFYLLGFRLSILTSEMREWGFNFQCDISFQSVAGVDAAVVMGLNLHTIFNPVQEMFFPNFEEFLFTSKDAIRVGIQGFTNDIAVADKDYRFEIVTEFFYKPVRY